MSPSSQEAGAGAQEEQQQPTTRWASLADRLNPNRAAFDPKLKEEWKTLAKASRKKMVAEDRRKILELRNRATEKKLPFPTDPDDHCETSKTAYGHIVPFLNLVADKLASNKKKNTKIRRPSDLRIYDPYYCAGAVARHLNELGFPNVHNRPDDFYKTIAENSVPPHDVLVTNPPYSGDHFDRLKCFLAAKKKNKTPHLLLVPDHFRVAEEDYAFLKPADRYHYWTPRGLRPEEDSKKRKHRNLVLGNRNSPFPSKWCISLEPLVSKQELLNLMEGDDKLPEGCKLLESFRTRDAREGAKFRQQQKDPTTKEEPNNDAIKQKKKKNKRQRNH